MVDQLRGFARVQETLYPLAPVFEIQSLPFAFTSEAQVYALMDGALGGYLRAELEIQGVYAVPGGLMDNGFRHISTVDREIRGADDLAGVTITDDKTMRRAVAAAAIGNALLDIDPQYPTASSEAKASLGTARRELEAESRLGMRQGKTKTAKKKAGGR